MGIKYAVAFTVLKSPRGPPPLPAIPVHCKSACQVSHSHTVAELPCPFSVLTPLLQQQAQLIPATSWKPLLTWLPGPCSPAHLTVGFFTDSSPSPKCWGAPGRRLSPLSIPHSLGVSLSLLVSNAFCVPMLPSFYLQLGLDPEPQTHGPHCLLGISAHLTGILHSAGPKQLLDLRVIWL